MVSHLGYNETKPLYITKLLHHYNGTLFSLNARMQCNSFVTLMSLIGSFNSFYSFCLLFVDGKYFYSLLTLASHFWCVWLVLSSVGVLWNEQKEEKCINNHLNYISCIVVFSPQRQVSFISPYTLTHFYFHTRSNCSACLCTIVIHFSFMQINC